MTPNMIRNNLDEAIACIEENKAKYVKNPDKDFTRHRKISISDILKSAITMEGGTLKKEVYRYSETSNIFYTTSAYVQQRSKILLSAYIELFHKFNELSKDRKTFNGYYVYAADGSYINVYENPDEKDSYIKSSGCAKGYNLLELHALYDIYNNTFKDAIIKPAHKSNERVALQEMLMSNNFEDNSIIIVDRGYEGYNMFAHFINTPNVDFVCRVNQGMPLKPTKHLPMCELDQDISFEVTTTQTKDDKINNRIHLPQKSKKGNSPKTKIKQWDFPSPYRFNLRVVRVMLENKNYETIITSLPRDKFPMETIKQLYHMRWQIEIAFRMLKYAIGLRHLHSKKEEYVQQEIYARLIAYNLTMRLASCVPVQQKRGQKHRYQVSYVMAVLICKDFYRKRKKSASLIEELMKYIEPVRPGRSEKRNIVTKGFVPFAYRISA